MNWTFVYNMYFMCILYVFVLEFVFIFDIMCVFLSFMYIRMKIYNVLGHVNQFRIDTDTTTEDKTDFISYNSHCVSVDWKNRIIIFGKDWNYSKTTRKHLYAFFDELGLGGLCDKKSILQAIEEGVYNTPYTQYKVLENYDL